MSENNAVKLPEVIVFAGPNGSGKTTITGMAKTVGEYINADDIKRTTLCTDIEAAQKAEELREKMVLEKKEFTSGIFGNFLGNTIMFRQKMPIHSKW